METAFVTTPFGRRAITLAQVQTQLSTMPIKGTRAVDKWKVLRDICEARARLNLRDRALTVLQALLSFHPTVELSAEENLVVFPSNASLSARAHGIRGTTLRENLSVLIAAGIIHRRDSPNGKRFARKGDGGRIETAYGFSLAPLIARANEFAALALDAAAERRTVQTLREKIALLRRDIRKLITAAVEERVAGDWAKAEVRFAACLSRKIRGQSAEGLIHAEAELAELKAEIVKQLTSHWNSKEPATNDSDIRHHIEYQNTESIYESDGSLGRWKKKAIDSECAEPIASRSEPERMSTAVQSLPLSVVLRSCPQIVDYGPSGRITSWRDLVSAAVVVRTMLGVSSSAYQQACSVMSPEGAATVMACILERANQISQAGAYLNTLTRKAIGGQLSLASMVATIYRSNMLRKQSISITKVEYP